MRCWRANGAHEQRIAERRPVMRGEQGTMTLFLLGTALSLLFLAGIVVDFWRVIAVRRELAAMADSAATAGANGLDETSLRTGGADLDPVRARALASAQLQMEPGAGRIASSQIDADASQVVVQLHARVRYSLLGILVGGGAFDVAATATAAPRRVPDIVRTGPCGARPARPWCARAAPPDRGLLARAPRAGRP